MNHIGLGSAIRCMLSTQITLSFRTAWLRRGRKRGKSINVSKNIRGKNETKSKSKQVGCSRAKEGK